MTAPLILDAWNEGSDELRSEVIRFWQSEGVLPADADPAQRARQLASVAKDESGHILGVATVFKAVHPRLEHLMYNLRVYVAPGARRAHLSIDLTNVARAALQKFNATQPKAERALGLIAEIETPALQAGAGHVARQVVWPTGLTFIGRTPRGTHLRVVYFEGAELTFPETPP